MGSRRATAVGFFPFRLPLALPGVFSSRKPMLERHLSTSKVLQLYPPACCNSIRFQGIPCHEKFFIFTVFHNKTGFYSGCIHVITAGAFFRRYSDYLKLFCLGCLAKPVIQGDASLCPGLSCCAPWGMWKASAITLLAPPRLPRTESFIRSTFPQPPGEWP